VSFYRYAALLCRRAKRRRAALAYYLRAALRDPGYLSTGFANDLAGMAAGAVRAVHDAAPHRSGRRRARRMRAPHQAARDRQWRAAGQLWLRDLDGVPLAPLDASGNQ
jgi:hypothetical protein